MTKISKGQIIDELKKEFPRMQKHEDIADVLIAGQHLHAINKSNKIKRWKFLETGVTSNAFYRACKYNLLNKHESTRRAFVMSMRGIRLKNKEATFAALKKERIGLLKHLAVSSTAKNLVSNFLSLPTPSLRLIKQKLEEGDSQDQLIIYGKVVNHLVIEKKYNKSYDYYWMGFRYIGDQYWLSEFAHKMLSKVIV